MISDEPQGTIIFNQFLLPLPRVSTRDVVAMKLWIPEYLNDDGSSGQPCTCTESGNVNSIGSYPGTSLPWPQCFATCTCMHIQGGHTKNVDTMNGMLNLCAAFRWCCYEHAHTLYISFCNWCIMLLESHRTSHCTMQLSQCVSVCMYMYVHTQLVYTCAVP